MIENMKKDIRMYKYIGETSRSPYERAWEHEQGMLSLNPGSYMLKRCVDQHEGEEIDPTQFGIKVVKFTTSLFETQVLESVVIQEKEISGNK